MMVSDSRISGGKEFINLYKEDLMRAEDLYGVPAEIIASIIGIIPVVGVPLPLISQGGTSIVVHLLAFGVILSMKNLVIRE